MMDLILDTTSTVSFFGWIIRSRTVSGRLGLPWFDRLEIFEPSRLCNGKEFGISMVSPKLFVVQIPIKYRNIIPDLVRPWWSHDIVKAFLSQNLLKFPKSCFLFLPTWFLLSFMLGLSGLIVVSRASTSLLPTMNPLCAHHHSDISLCLSVIGQQTQHQLLIGQKWSLLHIRGWHAGKKQ